MAGLFYLLPRVFARNLLRRNYRMIFFYFVLMSWPGIRTRTLRLVRQHTTYQTYVCSLGHYNSSIRITVQLLTLFMLCALILYISRGIQSLTSTPNDSFLRNFFMAGYFIYSQEFFQKSAEKKSTQGIKASVCVNFIKSSPNDRCFEKFFMTILFYSQNFCQKSAERKSPKKYFSYFILMSGLGLELWLYLLDYGDFKYFYFILSKQKTYAKKMKQT